MKVGILNAINPDESTVNWGGTPVDAYIRFFESVDAPFEYTGYEVTQGQLPKSTGECEAYVITGSPRGAYDSDPWIGDLSQFIRDGAKDGKKFAGICFGHQILAEALGGRVQKSEKGWGLGLKSFEIRVPKSWMNGDTGHASLYFAHQDQVIELPPDAELLGGNGFCPIALYTIRDQILGVQGHPEFSQSIMQDILSREKLGRDDDVVKTAESSLADGKPDGRLFAQWIVNFLTFDPQN